MKQYLTNGLQNSLILGSSDKNIGSNMKYSTFNMSVMPVSKLFLVSVFFFFVFVFFLCVFFSDVSKHVIRPFCSV